MTPVEFESFLHRSIPLCRAMALSVVHAGPTEVTLRAPLEPNINHNGTAFGGSVATLATLAAWSAVELTVREAGLSARIAIRRSAMEFNRPITSEFTATAALPSNAERAQLLATLERGRMARIAVRSRLRCGDAEVGELTGEFAVQPA